MKQLGVMKCKTMEVVEEGKSQKRMSGGTLKFYQS
jgi:hypothetical protein